MTMSENNAGQQTFLERAYALSDAPGAKNLYDEWAGSYDADLKDQKYASPQRTVEAILKYTNTSGSDKILVLDAGTGTGLVGQILATTPIASRLVIDGNDVSPGMLDESRRKNVFRKLEVVDLTKPLDIADASYDVISCVGTLTKGHVGPSVLSEFVRITKPGGIVAATVHDEIWQSGGYKKAVDELVKQGKVESVEEKDFGIIEGDSTGGIMLVLRRQ